MSTTLPPRTAPSRPCDICREPFTPHIRNKRRQKICGKPACLQELNKRRQAARVAKRSEETEDYRTGRTMFVHPVLDRFLRT